MVGVFVLVIRIVLGFVVISFSVWFVMFVLVWLKCLVVIMWILCRFVKCVNLLS